MSLMVSRELYQQPLSRGRHLVIFEDPISKSGLTVWIKEKGSRDLIQIREIISPIPLNSSSAQEIFQCTYPTVTCYSSDQYCLTLNPALLGGMMTGGIENGNITTSIPELLEKNPDISNTDLATVLKVNLPKECYLKANIRISTESYQFRDTPAAIPTRVFRIQPFGDVDAFFRTIEIFFRGVTYSDQAYDTGAIAEHLLGIKKTEVSKSYCEDAFKEKREIIIKIATKNQFHCELAQEVRGICVIL